MGKNLFYPNFQEIENFGIESYYCPDTKKLTLQGNWNAPIYAFFSLTFYRCSNDSTNRGYAANETCADDNDFG